jgi:hypothetical protein
MVDNGAVHRLQKALGNVGGTWNLKKVAAGVNHDLVPLQLSFFRNWYGGAFQAKCIFNGYSDFALIRSSPLEICCFFGFAAMPRLGVGGSFGQKTEADCKLPA